MVPSRQAPVHACCSSTPTSLVEGVPEKGPVVPVEEVVELGKGQTLLVIPQLKHVLLGWDGQRGCDG